MEHFKFPVPDFGRSLGFLNRSYIECITCGPVVYVRTLKSASTFFYNSLRYGHRWDEINFNDIDWDRQHVFSHLVEPITRRHKGIAEYVDMLGMTDDFWNNASFQKLVSLQPMLDMHSMSLSQFYGKRMWLIDWIPISDNHYKTIADTEKLLTYLCGIRYFRWQHDHAHVSDPGKKAIEQQVKELWNKNQASTHPLIQAYFTEDLSLYKNVMNLYNPHGNTWDHMSWLRHREQWTNE